MPPIQFFGFFIIDYLPIQSATFKNYLYVFFYMQQCTLSIKWANIKISVAISVALLSQGLRAGFWQTFINPSMNSSIFEVQMCNFFILSQTHRGPTEARFDDACCRIINWSCWLLFICSVRSAVRSLTALCGPSVLKLCDRMFLTVVIPGVGKQSTANRSDFI